MEEAKGARPGPAAADRGRSGPFGALVSRATHDADAALALALAYDETPIPQRHHFLAAVEADARVEGVCPAGALLTLLSVEEDPTVALGIVEALARCEVPKSRAPSEASLAVEGDERAGRLLLSRPLHGSFAEVLELHWSDGQVDARHEPLVDAAEAEGRIARAGGGPAAADRLAGALWTLRRHTGVLPTVVARFVDLLDSPASRENLE